MIPKKLLQEYGPVSVLSLLLFFVFVVPLQQAHLLTNHLVGDGVDEVSFLHIFYRLGSNLLSLRLPPWDGKILFPATDSLLFSETMLIPAVLYRTLVAISGNLILSFNLVLLLFFWSNSLSLYWLARSFFGRAASTIVSIIFSYSLIRLAHVEHSHCLPQLGFPLVVGCLVRYAQTKNGRWLVGAGVLSALQFYFSVTLGIILALSLLPCTIFLLFSKALRPKPKTALLTIVLGSLLVAPLGLSYRSVTKKYGFERSSLESTFFSADWKSYFTVPPAHSYAPFIVDKIQGGQPSQHQEKNLFLGFSCLFLLGFGLTRLKKKYGPSPYLTCYLISLAFVVVLSFGWSGGLYALLYKLLPIVKGMRTPARFGLSFLFLSLFPIAVALESILKRRRAIQVTLLTSLAILFYFDSRYAIQLSPVESELQGVTQALAATPDRDPVLFVPMVGSARMQAMQMYYSLIHDHPIANGYCGFYPPTYHALVVETLAWINEGSPRVFDLMDQEKIPYLVLQKGAFVGEEVERLKGILAQFGFRRVYEDDRTVLARRYATERVASQSSNRGSNEMTPRSPHLSPQFQDAHGN